MASYENDPRLRRIVDDVVARAIRLVAPDRVWLFGSQARGTARRGSDVDIALAIPDGKRSAWSRFVNEAAEEVPALVNLDLVDVHTCSAALRDEILRTGEIVYDGSRQGS